MNVSLLRQVQKQILKDPRQFDMRMWFKTGPSVPNCATAACIAGWALSKAKKMTPLQMAKSIKPSFGRSIDEYLGASHANVIMDEAQQFLGLTTDQAERLFVLGQWPDKFYHAYWSSRSASQRAKVASNRINFFIKTKGTDQYDSVL